MQFFNNEPKHSFIFRKGHAKSFYFGRFDVEEAGSAMTRFFQFVTKPSDFMMRGERCMHTRVDGRPFRWPERYVQIMITMITGLLLALCMFFTAVGSASAAPAFSDIHGHWAEPQITSWMEQGLIKGYGDGSFRPNHTITRAEFVALVNRSFGLRQAGDVPFHDINETHWAYSDVAIAVQSGYISGYQDGTFGAERKISRQEVAVIAVKTAWRCFRR